MRPILALAALGLILATGFAFAARLWWAFDLFSHFRLQYVVLALVLGTVALACRLYPLAAVFLLVAGVHAFAMRDLWLGGDPTAAGTPLRVVSANVLRSNRTPEQTRDFVRASGADVVVLIDARRRRWPEVLAPLAEAYPHGAPRGWQEEGAPVILLSRHPIVRDSVLRPPAGRRPFIAAELTLEGRTLTVVGVHPSSPSPRDPEETRRRNLQLDYLAELIEGRDGPIVLAGDFNTTPFSPYFQGLLAEGGLRPAIYGSGYVGTWPDYFWPALIPIDHVLVKGPITVADMRAGPAIGSDHYPIVADLKLWPQARVSGSPSTSPR